MGVHGKKIVVLLLLSVCEIGAERGSHTKKISPTPNQDSTLGELEKSEKNGMCTLVYVY